MRLTCQNCKKKWDYHGKKKPNKQHSVYVACPVCHSSVKLEEQKEEVKQNAKNKI